jgi:hypothetical protein
MRNVTDVVDRWPRAIDLARDLGVSPSRITDWKNRNAIPASYWKSLLAAARRRMLWDITPELLIELHSREPEGRTSAGFAEEEAPAIMPSTEAAKRTASSNAETGHFSRHKAARRARFHSAEEIEDHIRALREEWSHR